MWSSRLEIGVKGVKESPKFKTALLAVVFYTYWFQLPALFSLTNIALAMGTPGNIPNSILLDPCTLGGRAVKDLNWNQHPAGP